MEGFNKKAFDERVGEAHEEALKVNAELDSVNEPIEEIKEKKEVAGSKEQFETWQTIETGGKSKDELKTELEEKGRKIGVLANQLLDGEDFKTSESKERVDFVRPSVKDLGFEDTATLEEVCERAEGFGLELCHAEDAPHLRSQYDGDESMVVAMKKLAGPDDSLNVFSLFGSGGELWLGTNSAHPGIRWNADDRFVFRQS